MASIERREASGGAVSWRVKVRLRGYPPATASFQRKTDAKRWAQRTEADMRAGRYFPVVEAGRRTLADLIDRNIRDEVPKKKTGPKQARQLEWWREQLGVYLLKDVTPALLVEARDRLAAEPPARRHASGDASTAPRRRAPATVNRYLAALSHAFTVASKEWGWLGSNPMTRVRRYSEPKGRVRYLDDAERDRLLEVCREGPPYLYPIVVLALSTGMRRGEILGLRWPDVDLARGHVILHDTKNGERRGLPLTGAVLDTLRDWARVRHLDSDLVFPATGAFDRVFRRHLALAGIEGFRFHDLRHSAASYLAMNGATPSDIAAVLGHKTLAMVKRYAHLSDAHVRGVVESMNERIFGGGA